MSEEPIFSVINKVREILENSLKELAQLEERYKTMPPEVKLNLDQINALPWTAYRSGKGEWLLHEKYDAAIPLKEALKKAQNKTFDIGGFRYKLGGDRGQFLSRFPTGKQ